MIGRQVIKSERIWESKEQLYAFMEENWNKEEYGEFWFGRPTAASAAEYICLPATPRFMVIVYPKKKKVVLTVCDSPQGARSRMVQSIPIRDESSVRSLQWVSLVLTKKNVKARLSRSCRCTPPI